jgi:hypothetical protein
VTYSNKPETDCESALSKARNELRQGPFSILSERALYRLALMLERVASDAYDRGYVAGEKDRKA